MSEGVPQAVLEASGIDNFLDILSKRHRRLILLTLEQRETVHKSELMFRGTDNADDEQVQLHHTHLPKLDEAEYIEWNRETDEVSKGPRYDEIKPLLDLIADHADELPPNWP